MLKYLLFGVFFFGLYAMGQSVRNPLEASAGFGAFTNINTLEYHHSVLSDRITRDLSPDEFKRQFWNQDRTTIREYFIGGSLLLGQSRRLDKEWLFNLDVSGQFQHHYIFSGQSETLLEEMIIDSVNSIRSYENKLLNVTEINDVLFVKPSISRKYHLNRRFNIKLEGEVGVGIPIKSGFEVIVSSGVVERSYQNQVQLSEESLQGEQSLEHDFINNSFYMALSTSLKPAIEYRIFEYRSIFISFAGVIGRQVHLRSQENNWFQYQGGEFKIISRF